MNERNPIKLFGPRLTAGSFFWQRGLIEKPPAGEMTGEKGSMSEEAKAATRLERVWAWLHRTFPERQIYIRSDGRVQFFTFGASLQATLAGLALIFLGWVAFATVNVVFKDRIIAAKDHRFQQMQSAYENRLADLQISYDELNGALVGAEDKFKATADALAARQNAIAGFLNRKSRVEAVIKVPAGAGVTNALRPAMDGVASDSVGFSGTGADAEDDPDSSLTMLPGPAPAQPRVEKPLKASLVDQAWRSIVRMASGLFDRRMPPPGIRTASLQHPGLKMLTVETARLAALGASETGMMAQTELVLDGDVDTLRAAVKRTGINPDQFLSKAEAGTGGPEIPLTQASVAGVSDPRFNQAYLRASAVLSELDSLSSEVSHIPFTTPVMGAAFDRSSGFGARIDPFTGHYAFHPGVDFAGPWGAAVTATAPGTVIFAGVRGGYGNMVEIDHGFGVHTRYGHLSKITVVPGARIGKGSVVGRLGSTGRSTGPHVHYEVWYDNVVRNPSNFIEAGRHVL
jgi:murein DD-endopeptidase MepM/ murein hydrolase activator NlpD